MVPDTGIIKFEVHAAAAAFSGSFAISAEEFATKSGAVDGDANQGNNVGFSFPMGQNRAFHVSHRVFSGAKRFLVGSSDIQSSKSGDDRGWNITITHITGNGLIEGSVVEDQLAAGVIARLDTGPEYKPGPTPHTFKGTNRATAIAALDKYLDGVSIVTQASVRIISDADNYITVSIHPDVAVGPKGNKWSLVWNGDSSSPGEESVETFDNLFRAVVQWDAGAATLEQLHVMFHGDSKFESVVTGDDTSLVSISETFGTDTVGNTIFFQGGARVHNATPHSWFAHYVDNPAATVTLEYESRQEMQVWDAPSIDFKPAFTLLDSPTKPNPWTILRHTPADASPEEWQWTLLVTTTRTELIQRSGGTVTSPVKGTVRPIVPITSEEVWVRLFKGVNDINMVKLDTLLLADGSRALLEVEFRLGVSGLNLQIAADGHIHMMRTTGTTGNVLIGCDVWYR